MCKYYFDKNKHLNLKKMTHKMVLPASRGLVLLNLLNPYFKKKREKDPWETNQRLDCTKGMNSKSPGYF